MDIARRTQKIVAGLRQHVAKMLDRNTVDGLRWMELQLCFTSEEHANGMMNLILPITTKATVTQSLLLLELQLIGWKISEIRRMRSVTEAGVKMDWVWFPKTATPPTAELFPESSGQQQNLTVRDVGETDLEVKREA